VAILEVDQAPASAKADAIAQAHKLVKRVQKHVATDKRIESCDESGFDVEVKIRPLLGGALTKLDEALTKGLVA
jgi:hypothetical protein